MQMESQQTSRTDPHIRPCRHMEKWVHALADGSLTGWRRWYTRLHVAGCRRCEEALHALEAMRERLRTLGAASTSQSAALSAERRAALESALNAIDEQSAAGE